MIQHLIPSEKKLIEAVHERSLECSVVAADLVVGRHLREFVRLQDEVDEYIKEVEKRKE